MTATSVASSRVMYSKREFKDMVSLERDRLKEINERRMRDKLDQARKSVIKSLKSEKTSAKPEKRMHRQKLSERLVTFAKTPRTSIRFNPDEAKAQEIRINQELQEL